MALYAEKDGVLYVQAPHSTPTNQVWEILVGENDSSPFTQVLIEDILNIKHKRSKIYYKAMVPRGAVHLGNGSMYPLHLLLGTHEDRQVSAARRGSRVPPEDWIERSKRRVYRALGIEPLIGLTPDDESYRDTQRMLALEYIFEEKEGILSSEAWALIEGTPGIECKGEFESGYHVRVVPKVKAL